MHCREIAELAGYYHDSMMPYDETLDMISRHRAYLELLQKGQSGMTLRPLEALFMGRKLITDNVSVTSSDIYHASRILVLDKHTTSQDVIDFLAVPFLPLEKAEIERHDINHWFKNFQS